VEFFKDTSADEIRLLFTAAAECDPTDVLKLTTRSGRLLKLSADLPVNKRNNRYRLHVTAAPVTGATIISTLGLNPYSNYQRRSHCGCPDIPKIQVGVCDTPKKFKDNIRPTSQ